MANLNDLARQHTSLSAEGLAHLQRLVGSWGPLADLCFADLLLFAPATQPSGGRLIVLSQIRATTAQTLYQQDQVGRFVDLGVRPLIGKAIRTGEVVEDEIDLPLVGFRVRVMAVPVSFDGEVIAVMTQETSRLGSRLPGELERTYLGVFRRFSQMIAEGSFPFPFEDIEAEESPRVGDGAVMLDADAKVQYTSPNAVSALRRVGFHGDPIGRRLQDLGFHAEVVHTAFKLRVSVVEELERGENVSVLVRILPLLSKGEVDGALILMRDVSDLRRRDRLLVSMDATIREIHHRVKNNLQTVSSLLRLQGRRLESPEAKAAIEESVRRIRSIAVVHEILSQDGVDDVVFAEVVRPIVRMVEASLVAPDRPVRFNIIGDGPILSANVASSLAVVVTELIQNAVEHGYPPGSSGGVVTVELVFSGQTLDVRVHDDGVGLVQGFDIKASAGLGLAIVGTLVSGELNGELTVKPSTAPNGGTVAQLRATLASVD